MSIGGIVCRRRRKTWVLSKDTCGQVSDGLLEHLRSGFAGCIGRDERIPREPSKRERQRAKKILSLVPGLSPANGGTYLRAMDIGSFVINTLQGGLRNLAACPATSGPVVNEKVVRSGRTPAAVKAWIADALEVA